MKKHVSTEVLNFRNFIDEEKYGTFTKTKECKKHFQK